MKEPGNLLYLMTQGVPVPDSIPFAERFRAVGRNTGNLLFIEALMRQLAYKHIGFGLCRDPGKTNEEFDTIVIPASNFINEYADFGHLASEIESTSLKCFIAGVGAQSSRYDTIPKLKPGTERFIKVVAERAVTVGVRGAYTADVLSSYGIKNTRIIGCPSLFYNLRPEIKLRIGSEEPSAHEVVFNGSRNVTAHSFDPHKMEVLEQQIFYLAMESGSSYILQNEVCEMELLEQIHKTESLSEDCVKRVLRAWNIPRSKRKEFLSFFQQRVCVFYRVVEWLDFIKRFKLVIGSRFHGAIAGILSEVPAVLIAHDTRTEELARFVNLPYLHLSKVDTIDIEKLYRDTDFSIFESRFPELLSNYVEFIEQNDLAHNFADVPLTELTATASPRNETNDQVVPCLCTQVKNGSISIGSKTIICLRNLPKDKYLRKRNIQDFEVTDHGISLISTSDDPSFVFRLRLEANHRYYVKLETEPSTDTYFQLFWSKDLGAFDEKKSLRIGLRGMISQLVYCSFIVEDAVEYVRIDPMSDSGQCRIWDLGIMNCAVIETC